MSARGSENRSFDGISLCVERTGLREPRLRIVIAAMAAAERPRVTATSRLLALPHPWDNTEEP